MLVFVDRLLVWTWTPNGAIPSKEEALFITTKVSVAITRAPVFMKVVSDVLFDMISAKNSTKTLVRRVLSDRYK